MSVAQRYLDNCYVIKLRLIWSRRQLEECASLIEFENIILSIRKIVEGLAFCSLISAEVRVGEVPRQIRNNWNAEDVFQFLRQRSMLILPDFARLSLEQEGGAGDSPSMWKLAINASKDDEVDRLVTIYRQCHKFLHEFNPYLGHPLRDDAFANLLAENCERLKRDHMWIWNRFWQHSIRMEGKMFFINFLDDAPGVSPQVVRSDNFLTVEDFEFSPLPWTSVFREPVARKAD